LVIHSFAKLNLFLKVINKRPDNYHNLITLFERISLSDSITLKNLKHSLITVKCSDKSVPQGPENLCFKAAGLLRDNFAKEKGVEINITKNIPVGAGLGGGSSNAAAVLLGLNRLWKINLPVKQLVKVAGKVGSDVPFFIYEKPFGLGLGRGERIKPLGNLNKIKLWHVLVVPKIKVSTPLMYKHWDCVAGLTPLQIAKQKASCSKFVTGLTPLQITKQKASCSKFVTGLTKPVCDVKILTSELAKRSIFLRSDLFFNSLEQVTARIYPEVKRVKNTLLGLGVSFALMSGSGPSVFSLIASRREAVRLARAIKRKYKSWRIYTVSTV